MGKILWLASYPKSGNTWLRAFLANLFVNPKDPVDINQLPRWCFSDSRIEYYRRLDPRFDQTARDVPKKDVAALRARIQENFTKLSPDTVFVKTHNALVENYGLPLIAPDHMAGAIYVVRNPLDVAISHAHHYGNSLDFTIDLMGRPGLESENEDRHVFEHWGSWSEHVESWTRVPSRGLHVVRYEDMLEFPKKTFLSITKFLGVNPGIERLDKAIKFSNFKILRAQEQKSGFMERPQGLDRFFREGKAGQWKTILSQKQIDRLVSDHRTQMARFGYLKGIE